MFYEEIPGRPPFLLRMLLPQPIRSEGDKSRAGETVRCIYARGELVKRITTVEQPHFLEFEVIGQHLGIEGCLQALGGSYVIRPREEGSEIVLITNYRSKLRPRGLWRPIEKLLIGQLHRHILQGICAAIAQPSSPKCLPAEDTATVRDMLPGGIACTTSHWPSRR